ncbi:MAG: AMP-binding protein [Pirellulales bacterium]
MKLLPQAFIRQCKRRPFRSKVADSTGADLTGGALLTRTLVLRRIFRRRVLASEEKHVGLLLPPSVGAVVANVALTLDRRIAVNLNYTVSSQVMDQCIELAGIRHVLTSRRFMEKVDYRLPVDVVYLEDLGEQATWVDKLVSTVTAYAVPARLIERALTLDRVDPDDVLTIIFTSGTTGVPKGVMLTYANIGANAAAIGQVVRLVSSDVVLGILPFFHSFGFTVTLWAVLTLDVKGAYHFDPLDARQIGKLCQQHHGTFLLSTPTFLRTYLRRCTKEQLASMEVVVAGAERLPADLCDAFEKKFGVRPVEGYGTTELSPLVSVNVPPTRSPTGPGAGMKEGTVGRPVPGVSVKIVDRETGETLGTGESGMLLATGPNVMKGYMNQPEKTAEVVREGWYVTGDVAFVDEEGFITITGRESRFSKIGGEMVPHIQVEEALNKIVGGDQGEEVMIAVTAVPHAKKGERLVVLHTAIDKTPRQLCDALVATGLPKLYIPSPDSFHQVDVLPLLGTGKFDLKSLKQMAIERFATEE